MNIKYLALLVAVSLTGCYPMPRDDDYSVVPSINNPDYTRETPGQGAPGGGQMPMPGGGF